MIDIHCHILPGLDDGAQSLEESVEMAREAVKEGIEKIIVTPHHKLRTFDNPRSKVSEKTAELNSVFADEGIPLSLSVGQEIRIFGELPEELETGEIAPLNDSRYLLIEFPSNHVPSYTDRLFYELQMKGYVPVIAHPERNQQLTEQPDKLYDLVEKGALSQVTAASVCGLFGKKIQDFSFRLIEANLVHFVASDAHNTGSRGFRMAEALDAIEKKFGLDTLGIFLENGRLAAENQTVYKEIPEKIKRKRLFGIF